MDHDSTHLRGKGDVCLYRLSIMVHVRSGFHPPCFNEESSKLFS